DRKNDFGLKVEMVGSRKGPKGLPQLVDGQDVRFRVETEKDAFVEIWTFDAAGNKTQLFPNKFDKDNLIKANAPRTLPDARSELFAGLTDGTERVVGWAPSQRGATFEPKADGNFVAFKPDQKEEFQRLSRAIFVREASANRAPLETARTVIPYVVVP